MFTLFVTLLFSMPTCFRTRATLQAEVLALRKQFLVLQCSNNRHRVRLRIADRPLWASRNVAQGIGVGIGRFQMPMDALSMFEGLLEALIRSIRPFELHCVFA